VVSGVLQGGSGHQGSTLGADLVTLLGTLGWITYTRGAARLPSLDVVEYSALTAVASWPLLLLATLASTLLGGSPAPEADAVLDAWHALLYIGVLPSVVAILAFNFGVRTLGVVTGTAFLNFVPVSAVLMSIALGHPPAAHEIAGVAMVVGALLIHTLAQQRSATAAAPAGLRPAASGGR
jgi:drug/metabolite transporter (DMT)-like permease